MSIRFKAFAVSAIIAIAILLGSCAVQEEPQLFILASVSTNYTDPSKWDASVILVENFSPFGGGFFGDEVLGATVSLDGNPLTYGGFLGGYEADTLDLTSPATLVVSADGVDISASLDLPGTVNITSPADLSTYDPSGSLTIIWDSISPQPDNVEVFISPLDTVSGDEYAAVLPGSATSHTIPAGTIDYGSFSTVEISVYAINQQLLSGEGVELGSSYSILAEDSITVSEP
jgi:hypothetical protein